MTQQRFMRVLALMIAVLVVAAGCSSPSAQAPKEAIQSAMTKSMEMESYTFTGSMAIDELNLPASLLEGMDPSMMDMVKNASLNVSGVYQADPMQMEMTLDLALQGDMAFNLQVPIVMTQDKMWVKIPQTPMLPLGEAAGKFIELDMKELAEQQGVEMPTLDLNTQRQMVQDITSILLKDFEEQDYFAEVSKEDAVGLPEGLDPDQIVKFYVTQETFEPMVMTIVDKVAPEIIDLLLNNEDYMKSLQLTKEDLEKAKEELANGDRTELTEALETFKQDVKVNELSLTTAIQNELPVYQTAVINLDVTNEGETAQIGLRFISEYGNINEDVTFEIGIPEDTISIEELTQQFMMGPAM